MNIGDLLDRGAISPRVTAPGKRQALRVVAEMAARSFGLKPAEVLDALLEREAVQTGVRLEAPVAFDAVDDRPVDLIFALFAPPDASGEHLRALARVSRVLRQADLREQLRKARGVDAILALLVQEARPSAA